MPNGQASLEYLIIALVVLSILGVSLAALQIIRSNAERSYGQLLSEHDARLVTDTAAQLCLLGPGNSRQIKLEKSLRMHSDAGELVLESGGFSLQRPLPCQAVAASLSGDIILKNEGGRISAVPA